MDQGKLWWRVLLWQRRFLLAAPAVGVTGAAVAVIASAGLVWDAPPRPAG
ncbi:hypothetical protein [Streptomyces griseus]